MYERRHSLEIAAYGGVATPAPNLATVFLITTLASIGLPTLNNFIGEYLVLAGRGAGQLHVGRFRRAGRDFLGLLHAVAVPAGVLWKGVRIGEPSYDGSDAGASGRRFCRC